MDKSQDKTDSTDSDSEYEIESEIETDTDFSASELEDDELYENEPAVISNEFVRISDAFEDERPDPVPVLLREFDGVNPAIGFENSLSINEFFEKFMSAEIISYIVECTNARAAAFFREKPRLNGKINSLIWRDVNSQDIFVFLALYIYMGIHRISEMKNYWSRKPLEPGVYFYTSAIMSRDRFFSILKFLRFSKPHDVRKDDPSTRISVFTRLITERSMTNVDPGKHISIDEALLLFKGRLHFRVYIRSKRARFGIKIYIMCRSDTYWKGYNSSFKVHFKSNSFDLPQNLNAEALSKSEKIVIDVAKNVLNQGRHLIIDSYFASTRLASFLESKSTVMTGTISPVRGVPTEMRQEQLAKFQSSFCRKGNILLLRWEDKASVYVISTKYNAKLVEQNKTYFGNKKTFCKKPYAIDKYNKYMNGVDMADQLLEPYEPSRKSLAWFKKLGLHLIMRMVLNSFITYRNVSESRIYFKSFLTALVEQLLRKNCPSADSIFDTFLIESARPAKRQREEVVHLMGPLPKLPGSRVRNPTKRCRVCYKNGLRVETRKCCLGCEDHPGICSVNHFKLFHRK